MNKQAPLCRYCGGKIAKYTRTVTFGWAGLKAKPATLEEAKKFTNEEVVGFRWYHETKDGERTGEKYVWSIFTWDGESYVDEFFCNGEHARKFGRLMATYGHSTKAYCAAMTGQKEKAEKEEVS